MPDFLVNRRWNGSHVQVLREGSSCLIDDTIKSSRALACVVAGRVLVSSVLDEPVANRFAQSSGARMWLESRLVLRVVFELLWPSRRQETLGFSPPPSHSSNAKESRRVLGFASENPHYQAGDILIFSCQVQRSSLPPAATSPTISFSEILIIFRNSLPQKPQGSSVPSSHHGPDFSKSSGWCDN